MQKMLIVRCLRLDRVLPAIGVFVSSKLASSFVEPPPFDLAAVYDESAPDIPLLFILTPGMDPTPLLAALAANRNQKWATISLGQGQAPKATKLLEESAKDGYYRPVLRGAPALKGGGEDFVLLRVRRQWTIPSSSVYESFIRFSSLQARSGHKIFSKRPSSTALSSIFKNRSWTLLANCHLSATWLPCVPWLLRQTWRGRWDIASAATSPAIASISCAAIHARPRSA